jgi:hypothetical protein
VTTDRVFFKIWNLIEGGAEGRFAIAALVIVVLAALSALVVCRLSKTKLDSTSY